MQSAASRQNELLEQQEVRFLEMQNETSRISEDLKSALAERDRLQAELEATGKQ